MTSRQRGPPANTISKTGNPPVHLSATAIPKSLLEERRINSHGSGAATPMFGKFCACSANHRAGFRTRCVIPKLVAVKGVAPGPAEAPPNNNDVKGRVRPRGRARMASSRPFNIRPRTSLLKSVYCGVGLVGSHLLGCAKGAGLKSVLALSPDTNLTNRSPQYSFLFSQKM